MLKLYTSQELSAGEVAVTEVCRICGCADLAAPISLRETMFGTGETFLYQQCNDCKCLQIVQRPRNGGS